MERPTVMVKAPATNQPNVMVAGPPKLSPVLYSVVIPVSTEMMENEKAKLDSTLHAAVARANRFKVSQEKGEKGREREREGQCGDVREVALELLLVAELPEARVAGVAAAAGFGVRSRGLVPGHCGASLARLRARGGEEKGEVGVGGEVAASETCDRVWCGGVVCCARGYYL